MKRLTATILLLLYFVTSTGATINYRFCMGEMANISLGGNKQKKCSKCGMEKETSKDNGCCKDEQQFIKLDNDQKANTTHFEIVKLQLEVISIALFNTNLFTSQDNYSFPESKGPLRSCQEETYLLNCVFRI